MTAIWSWNALSSRRLRGDVLLRGDVFRRKLGSAALAVWRLLIRWRTPGGLAWPGRKALIRHTSLTVSQLRTAMRRLRKLLLLADVGKIEREGASLWHYEVRGEPADGCLGAVWVRADAAREINRANAHGGRRRGAGRPKNQVAPMRIQAAPRITITHPLPPTGGESEARTSAHARTGMGEDRLGTGEGAALRGQFDAALAHAVNVGIVPDDPRREGVTAQRVPPPERLDPERGMEEQVSILLACYRGAVTARTGKRSGVFLRGGVKRSRYWGALCGAVKALHEHGIPPAAWAAWSVDIWRSKGDKKPPPLTWVWGAKRINERRGWFRTASTELASATLLWADSARRAVAVRERAIRLLWTEYQGGPLTEKATAAALGVALEVSAAEALDVWRALLAEALRDCDRAAAQLRAAPATGEVWLWG